MARRKKKQKSNILSFLRDARRRTLVIIELIVLITILLCGGVVVCRNRATGMESELLKALELNQADRVQRIQKVLDTPFYRLIAPQVQSSIELANRKLTYLQASANRLHQRLSNMENGGGRVSALTIAERAGIERELSNLPQQMGNPLSKRWQALCNREQSVLQEQKLNFINNLQRPLPAAPTFTGSPEQDLEACRKQLDEIRPRLKEFYTAPKSFNLSQQLIEPVVRRSRELQATTAAISSYMLFCEELRRSRSYPQHLTAAQRCNAAAYEPAAKLLSILPLLPPENEVKSALQKGGYLTTNEEQQLAAAQTLLKGGPTFTAEYPATAEQAHMVENLFTAPSLYHKLYQVTTTYGVTAYSEKKPQIDFGDNRVYLTRSHLDPEHNLENRHTRLDDIDKVSIRVIDSSLLMKHLNLSKRTFFLKANISRLLTQVLNFRHKDCPALAQAYVYYTLLRLIDNHQHTHMTGVRHCPTLREHAINFIQLVRRHNLNLNAPGVWLNNTPAIQQAESDFRSWFATRAGFDYTAEIKNNFGPLARVGLQYSGYVNATGQPALFRELPPGTTVWYMTARGFTSGTIGSPLEQSLPYSPIFNVL